MPVESRLIYWDSCIFIDYFQRQPDRIATLDSIVRETRDKNILLVTSIISQVEADFAEGERPPGRLDSEKLAALDAAWNDRDTLLLVDVHQGIVEEARRIVRDGAHSARGLRSADAIYLATAKYVGATSFHTYDERLLRWDGIFFPIAEPGAERPKRQPQ